QYIDQVIANAKVLAEELARQGFRIVSGGTDNHLILVDVMSRDVSGKIAEQTLDQAGMTVNKNIIPFDPRKPLAPSGIRIGTPRATSGIRSGTPAFTTRGMKQAEMLRIAGWIGDALGRTTDTALLQRIRDQVR